MSIKAYVGRQGSGKTYEVVSVVILGALSRGRRVVSNIAGLKEEAFRELLIADGVDEKDIGILVSVSHDQVLDPLFWRTDKDFSQGIESFIQPGDLLVLDEIWRFWEGFSSRGMTDRVMNFYRMHRHFVDEKSGITCDVALITQDILDISRRVRSVIEETYQMEKLTAVGSSKRYRVDIHQGGRTSRAPIRQLQRSYDPKFFGLYSSHSQAKEGGAGPREENIDTRGNVLSGVLFKIVLPLSIPLFGLAVWFIWGFFNPQNLQKSEASSADKQQNGVTKQGAVSANNPSSNLAQSSSKRVVDESSAWQVVGYYRVGDVSRVVLSSGDKVRLLVDPPNVKYSILGLEVALPDGSFATPYSGASARGGLVGNMGQRP